MNKKLKILFCAEDFGSLEQNLYLIKFLNEKKLLDKKNSIFICNKLFKDKIKQSHIFLNFYLSSINKVNEKKITQLSKKNNIDLAIVGLSIQSKSLDYKITKIMNKENISSLSIQDFWGYTGNFNKKVYPKYLLVADKYAEKLSKNKINSKIIISGLPKYFKKKSFISFKNNTKKINLLIIGQPEYVPGINSYYNFLKKMNFSNFNNVFYLAHPIEKNLKSFFKEKRIKVVNRRDLHKFLNRNFIIINSFSTLSYDILFSANFFKKNIFYKIIFLTFKKKLLNFIQKTVGSRKLPLTNHKNIFQLSNFKNSDIEIDRILKKNFLKNKLTRKYFLKAHSGKSFLKILNKLVRK